MCFCQSLFGLLLGRLHDSWPPSDSEALQVRLFVVPWHGYLGWRSLEKRHRGGVSLEERHGSLIPVISVVPMVTGAIFPKQTTVGCLLWQPELRALCMFALVTGQSSWCVWVCVCVLSFSQWLIVFSPLSVSCFVFFSVWIVWSQTEAYMPSKRKEKKHKALNTTQQSLISQTKWGIKIVNYRHRKHKYIQTAEPPVSFCFISKLRWYFQGRASSFSGALALEHPSSVPGLTPCLAQVLATHNFPQSKSDRWFTISPVYLLTALGYPAHNSAVVTERMKTSALWQQINYSLSLKISRLNKIWHNYINIQWTHSFITYAEEIQ